MASKTMKLINKGAADLTIVVPNAKDFGQPSLSVTFPPNVPVEIDRAVFQEACESNPTIARLCDRGMLVDSHAVVQVDPRALFTRGVKKDSGERPEIEETEHQAPSRAVERSNARRAVSADVPLS